MLPPDVGRLQIDLAAADRVIRSRATLEAENMVLHQQIIVLRRTAPNRLGFNVVDRTRLVGLYRLFPNAPETTVSTRASPAHHLDPRRAGVTILKECVKQALACRGAFGCRLDYGSD